jgi:hypothetical protein
MFTGELRHIDDLHTLEENKSVRLKKPMERRHLGGFPGRLQKWGSVAP